MAFRQFESRLLEYQPAVATAQLSATSYPERYIDFTNRDPVIPMYVSIQFVYDVLPVYTYSYLSIASYYYDVYVNAYHRDVVDKVLPYSMDYPGSAIANPNFNPAHLTVSSSISRSINHHWNVFHSKSNN